MAAFFNAKLTVEPVAKSAGVVGPRGWDSTAGGGGPLVDFEVFDITQFNCYVIITLDL
jgi:hypothetical protein